MDLVPIDGYTNAPGLLLQLKANFNDTDTDIKIGTHSRYNDMLCTVLYTICHATSSFLTGLVSQPVVLEQVIKGVRGQALLCPAYVYTR